MYMIYLKEVKMREDGSLASLSRIATSLRASADVIGMPTYPAHLIRSAIIGHAGGVEGLLGFSSAIIQEAAGEPSSEECALAAFIAQVTADTVLVPALRGGLHLWLCRLLQLSAEPVSSPEAAYAAYSYALSCSNLFRHGLDYGDADPLLVVQALAGGMCHPEVSVVLLCIDTLREYLQRQGRWRRTPTGVPTVQAALEARQVVITQSLRGVQGDQLARMFASACTRGSTTVAHLSETCLTAWLSAAPSVYPHAKTAWAPSLSTLQAIVGRLAGAGLALTRAEVDATASASDADGAFRLFSELCKFCGQSALQSAPHLFAAAVRLAGVQLKLLCDEADDILLRPCATVQPLTRAETVRTDGRGKESGPGVAQGEAGMGSISRAGVNSSSSCVDRLNGRMPALVTSLACAARAFTIAAQTVGGSMADDDYEGTRPGRQDDPSPVSAQIMLSLRDSLVHGSRACLNFITDLWMSDLQPQLRGGGKGTQPAEWITLAATWARRCAAQSLTACSAYLSLDPESLQAELHSSMGLACRLNAGDAPRDWDEQGLQSVTDEPLVALCTALAPRLEIFCCHVTDPVESEAGAQGSQQQLVSHSSDAALLHTLSAWTGRLCRSLSLAAMEVQLGQKKKVSKHVPMPVLPAVLHRESAIAALAATHTLLALLSLGTTSKSEADNQGDGLRLGRAARAELSKNCMHTAVRLSSRPVRSAIYTCLIGSAAGGAGGRLNTLPPGQDLHLHLARQLLAVAALAMPPVPEEEGGAGAQVGDDNDGGLRESLDEAAFDVFREVLPAPSDTSGKGTGALQHLPDGLSWPLLGPLALFDLVLDVTVVHAVAV